MSVHLPPVQPYPQQAARFTGRKNTVRFGGIDPATMSTVADNIFVIGTVLGIAGGVVWGVVKGLKGDKTKKQG